MATRGRPRQFDREHALHIAMQVFWAKGYEGSSLSELEKATGLSRPSLYAAFGDKDGLFREVVDYYRRTDGAISSTKLGEAGNTRQAIEAMLRSYALLFTEEGKGRGCLIVVGALNCTPERSQLSEELASIRRATGDALKARLQRAVDEGELPASTDADGLAQFYAAVLNGLSIQARDGASRTQLLAIVAHAMRAWDCLPPSS